MSKRKAERLGRILPALSIILLVSVFPALILAPEVSSAYSPLKAARSKQLSTRSGSRLLPSRVVPIGEKIKQAVQSGTGAFKTAPLSGRSGDGPALPFPVNENNGTPIFLDREAVSMLTRGMSKAAPGADPVDAALGFIEANRDVFRLENPREELILYSETTTPPGKRHLEFRQVYEGFTVWGHRLVVHFDETGSIYAVNGRYSPTPAGLDTGKSRINEREAIAGARKDLSDAGVANDPEEMLKSVYGDRSEPSAELVVRVDDGGGRPRLCWFVTIRPNVRDDWYYFIDAETGGILEKYNSSAWEVPITATAVDALGRTRSLNVAEDGGVYYLYDPDAGIYTFDAHGEMVSEDNPPTLVQSPDNTWTDPIAVSAHGNTREVYDYYLEEHGRRGVDGNGSDLPVIIHYTPDGKPLMNAFWNGRLVAFGDGAPFAAALDVVAHEITHGVVQYTVGLEYKFQSGALNEAFADIMAAMVDPDWEIAEDIPGGPIRDLRDPHRFHLPADMSEYRDLPLDEDNGGVHLNMSIPSRAGYLMAEKIGREKTADIWYNVLASRYLTPRAEFIDMRLASVQSAVDLYGEDSPEAVAVTEVFDEVGIVGGSRPEPPGDIPPLEGEDLIAFVYEYDNVSALAIARPTIETVDDIIIPTATNVFTGGSSPLTVCRDGALLMFVDVGNNLRMLDLDTYEETVLDDSGEWSSIRISPDACRLAATSIYPDSTIYVFDLENPEESKAIRLYTPSSEGVESNTALFADALDWDSTGSQIIYDVFHRIPVAAGDPIEFWDVNLVDVESGVITRVKTPTEHNIQVGNPSFAETNDRYVVCDLFSRELQMNVMVTMDLFTLDIKVLRDNGMIAPDYPNLGHPRYSPDDGHVIFQQYSVEDKADILYKIPLNGDRMTAAGKESAYFYGSLPVWFVRGEEPGPTDAGEDYRPVRFTLSQNFPNPFNPVTTIPFTLDEPGRVFLAVYDLLGRKIATLVDGYRPAGKYSVRFDGGGLASGTYLYRLESGGKSITRKMTLIR